MPLGFRVVIARRSRESRRGIFRKSWHRIKNKTKLGEKRGAKALHLLGLAREDAAT
jgi:hypothetical protein